MIGLSFEQCSKPNIRTRIYHSDRQPLLKSTIVESCSLFNVVSNSIIVAAEILLYGILHNKLDLGHVRLNNTTSAFCVLYILCGVYNLAIVVSVLYIRMLLLSLANDIIQRRVSVHAYAITCNNTPTLIL